jgi:hypothetical protein
MCPKNDRYLHRKRAASLKALPDLDGVTMREIHKMLDIKRMRCVEKHRDATENWILSAF